MPVKPWRRRFYQVYSGHGAAGSKWRRRGPCAPGSQQVVDKAALRGKQPVVQALAPLTGSSGIWVRRCVSPTSAGQEPPPARPRRAMAPRVLSDLSRPWRRRFQMATPGALCPRIAIGGVRTAPDETARGKRIAPLTGFGMMWFSRVFRPLPSEGTSPPARPRRAIAWTTSASSHLKVDDPAARA